MNANTFCFLVSFVAGVLIATAFACWKYHQRFDASAVVDMLIGQSCTFGGVLCGTLIILVIFAFIAGKFTNH